MLPAVARCSMSSVVPTLDKSLFKKTIALSAARLSENRLVATYRRQLAATNELFVHHAVDPVLTGPDKSKSLLLAPAVVADAPSTWSPTLSDGVQKGEISLAPFSLELNYEHFSLAETLKTLLPGEADIDNPSGFNGAGHVAHMNLRDSWLPYRHLIGQVVLDKNPSFRTVINKTDNVGTVSEFRTFPYEILAGEDDLEVEVAANDCTFRFDYGRVYWNSRLRTEHSRLIDLFKEGEVVCDVMAGVGPFAIPAGKKKVFVLANDLNPDSYKALRDNVDSNKVGQFVTSYQLDGAHFIQQSAGLVLEEARRNRVAHFQPKGARSMRRRLGHSPPVDGIAQPATVSHYVMNLPGSAISFLSAFRGLYHGHEALFSERLLPLIHVYTFVLDSPADPHEVIARAIQDQIGVLLEAGDGGGGVEGQMSLYDVRSVSPKKDMYCATFRLPGEVAFAARS